MNDQFGTETRKNGMAITSMVMGILGWAFTLIFLCVIFGIIPAIALATWGTGLILYLCACVPAVIPPIFWIIGLVTGYVGRNQITESGAGGMGMAKAGIIMAYIGLVLGILSVCVFTILLISGVPVLESIPGLESFQY